MFLAREMMRLSEPSVTALNDFMHAGMHKGWQHQHNSLEETSLSFARNKAK